MKNLEKTFEETCVKHFDFLSKKYGCDLKQREHNQEGFFIVYTNGVTGVKVSLELRENYIFVNLIKLDDGQIPSYLENPTKWVYIDELIAEKCPDQKIAQKKFGDWLTPVDVELIVKKYADMLPCFEDALRGDFLLFDKVVKARKKQPRT